MAPATIEAVMRKGGLAGQTILRDFNMEEHQWVRFRIVMGRLEQNLDALVRVLDHPDFDRQRLLARQLQGQLNGLPGRRAIRVRARPQLG
jgi:hypothetical protein